MQRKTSSSSSLCTLPRYKDEKREGQTFLLLLCITRGKLEKKDRRRLFLPPSLTSEREREGKLSAKKIRGRCMEGKEGKEKQQQQQQ